MTAFPTGARLRRAVLALALACAPPAAAQTVPGPVQGYALAQAPVGERAYQSAVSARGALYVTSAMGKTMPGAITVLDAESLRETGRIAPATGPGGRAVEVFGIAVDDRHGRVWTTSTLDSTVTVFDMATNGLARLFDKGTVTKPRDVAVDPGRGRAYVNTELTGVIAVFDTGTLERVGEIAFAPSGGGVPFAALNLDLDPAQGRIYAVDRKAPRVGWLDLDSGATTIIDVPGIDTGMGIAHDPETGRIYVSGLKSENVVTLDADGRVLADTPVGTGLLSLAWEPKSRRLFGASRTDGKVVVLDADGAPVAELPGGDQPNHLRVGPDGAVYLVSMSGEPGDGDPTGRVTRIMPAL